MAKDVVFLTSGRPPFGREEFAASFTAGLKQVKLVCSGEFEEVVVAGDVAYCRGRLSVVVTPAMVGNPSGWLDIYTFRVSQRTGRPLGSGT